MARRAGDKTMRVVRRAKSKTPYLNLHERGRVNHRISFPVSIIPPPSIQTILWLKFAFVVDYAGSAGYSAKIRRMTTKTALERSPMAAHWRRSERGKFQLIHKPMLAKY